MDKINSSPWPPIIATDGSHDDTDEDNTLNSAFFVILTYDGQNTTDIEVALNSTWTPILARGAYLPDNTGATPTDNGYSECLAVNLAEEALPTHVVSIIASDSLTTILTYRLLCGEQTYTHRVLMRKLLPSIGRGGATQMLRNLNL